MRILVGSFQCESNTFCEDVARKDDFEVHYGDEALAKLAAVSYFKSEGCETVPLVFASSLPSGMVDEKAYDFYEGVFLEKIREAGKFDGIYLYLHGAMYVRGRTTGEELLLRAIRKEVGEEVPISIASDFHANWSDYVIEHANAISGFRTTPHRDHDETEVRAAKALVKILRKGHMPRPVYVRIPTLSADGAVTAKEPFVTVMRKMYELDDDENVASCSLFNGQAWYDAEYIGANILMYVFDRYDEMFSLALSLAKFFWDRRDNLKLEGAMMPDDAVSYSETYGGKLLFVDDSGDNTTAGAYGAGTLMLKKYLESHAKNVLVTGIYAPEEVDRLLKESAGTKTRICLAKGKDEKQEKEVCFDAELLTHGKVYGWAGDEVGEGVLVKCGNIDVLLTNARAAFTTPEHFRRMNVDPHRYRVIVLKMGYLFPKLHELSDDVVVALTPGISTNDFTQIDFKRVKKPMYPKSTDISWDDIEKEARRSFENGISGT